ncbi:MAG: RNA methyltransferase [Bacteroidales bacterium]|nr:RNA methyltransferase [Bacteroidales bacterium]
MCMFEKISSVHNSRVRNIALLQAKSRERKKQNLFVIEGFREIFRALKGGYNLRELYYCPELGRKESLKELFNENPSFTLIELTREVFEKLAYREESDGLLALAEAKTHAISDLALPENPLIIILESVEKPGNLGAVMRTADAAAVDAVILCDPLTDLYNPNAIRSSLGCIFTRPVAVSSGSEVREWLAQNNISVHAAALSDQAVNFYLKDYSGPTAFVMGTESTGLSDSWMEFCPSTVIIPMLGVADSLNVSVSTAVLVYEALRQRSR